MSKIKDMFVKGDISAPYVPLHVLGLYQEGGEIKSMEEPLPAEGQGSTMEEIVNMAMQAVQEQDSDLAMQVCQMIVEFVQGQQGQVQEGMDQMPNEEEQPAMKSGGFLDSYEEYEYDNID